MVLEPETEKRRMKIVKGGKPEHFVSRAIKGQQWRCQESGAVC